jgi:hypothetical protein
MRKWLPWLAAALIVWWIATDPHGAAAFAHHLGGFIAKAAHSFATFFGSL